jgi:uncharacterized membrane protein
MGPTGQAKIIYVLYLAGFVSGFTPLIGLVMAYMGRGEGPDWLDDHYRWQIRTFWIGVLYSVIAGILTMVVIGFVLYVAIAVWWIVRCIKGLQRVSAEESLDDVETFLV